MDQLRQMINTLTSETTLYVNGTDIHMEAWYDDDNSDYPWITDDNVAHETPAACVRYIVRTMGGIGNVIGWAATEYDYDMEAGNG